MSGLWLIAAGYVLWSLVVGTREELLCRRLNPKHQRRDWLGYFLAPLFAPLVVLEGGGLFGGGNPSLHTGEKPEIKPLGARAKLVLTAVSLLLTVGSVELLFGSHAGLVVAFVVCHEGGHAFWARVRRVPIKGVGGVPFLGAFVALGESSPQVLGEIAAAGIVGGLFALPLVVFTADPFWGLSFIIGVSAFNALPWGPLDGKKVWLPLAWVFESRFSWTCLCVGIYGLTLGLGGLAQ